MSADRSLTDQTTTPAESSPAAATGDLLGADVDDTGTYLAVEEEEERIYIASPLQMMWWRFVKHKMAIVGGIVVILLYLVAIFAEFLAPYNPETYEVALTYAPPQRIHFFHNGEFQGTPFVYGLTQARNPDTLRMEFQTDETVRYPSASGSRAILTSSGVSFGTAATSSALAIQFSMPARKARILRSSPPYFCLGPINSAATCSPVSSMAPASLSPSA